MDDTPIAWNFDTPPSSPSKATTVTVDSSSDATSQPASQPSTTTTAFPIPTNDGGPSGSTTAALPSTAGTPSTPTTTSLVPRKTLVPSSPLGDELGKRQNRQVYFITYSKADMELFPTQNEFALALVDVIASLKLPLECWVASKEEHQDGSLHYHMTVKLSTQSKWLQIKKEFYNRHNVQLHFSCKTYGYAKAYQYTTKSSPPEWISHSEGHEDLTPIRVRTEHCMAANVQRGKQGEEKKRRAATAAGSSKDKTAQEPHDLRHKDVIKLVVDKKVGSYEHLQGMGEVRRRLGEWDLFNYLAIHTKIKIEEMIQRVWSTMQAPEKLSAVDLPRIAVVTNAKSGDCVANCEGNWRRMAEEIVSQNPLVDGKRLKQQMLANIDMGRCKGSTLFFVGPQDAGKSFLLLPIEVMFKTFSNPTRGTYNWVGVEDAECIFLNDFRWDKNLIAWDDLLRLLAGERLWFERPKNLFASNYLMDETNTIPIFGTGAKRTQWRGPYQAKDEDEDKQIECRITYFEFTYTIPGDRIIRRGVKPCPKCFAQFLMD